MQYYMYKYVLYMHTCQTVLKKQYASNQKLNHLFLFETEVIRVTDYYMIKYIDSHDIKAFLQSPGDLNIIR